MILQVLLFAFLAVCIGLALTFMGYSLFRILFPIWGFFIGLWLGGTAIAGLTGESFLATSFALICGFLLGLAFAVLAYYVYAFAVVLFGTTLGFAIGQGIILMLGIDQGFLSWSVGIITAAVFAYGFVVLNLPKIIIMVATAFAGSSAIIAGFLALFGQVPPERYLSMAMTKATIHTSWFWWLIWLVLAVFGVVVQSALSQSDTFAADYSYDSVTAEQATEPKAEPKKEEKETEKSE